MPSFIAIAYTAERGGGVTAYTEVTDKDEVYDHYPAGVYSYDDTVIVLSIKEALELANDIIWHIRAALEATDAKL